MTIDPVPLLSVLSRSMDVDFQAYKELFLKTARDYVAQIEQSIQSLQSNSTDENAINNTHIAAHSLKSQSYAVGFQSSAELFKTIENIFYEYKKNKSSVSHELLNDLGNWVTEFKNALNDIENTNQEKDLSAAVESAKKYTTI